MRLSGQQRGRPKGKEFMEKIPEEPQTLLQFIEGHPLLIEIAAPLAVAAILWLFAWFGRTLWKRHKERAVEDMSLDEALEAAVAKIECEAQKNVRGAVFPIVAYSSELSDYLTEELRGRLDEGVKLIVSAGGQPVLAVQAPTDPEAARLGRGQEWMWSSPAISVPTRTAFLSALSLPRQNRRRCLRHIGHGYAPMRRP